MQEEVLQSKLIELIKNESLLEAIINCEEVEHALQIDEDENYLPNFLVDYLLKRKYSESAKRVVKALDCYEIISGEHITSISLEKGETLYPDCILFNYEANHVILIENKTSKKTEREAITELFGYSHEIRNHLPFLSNFDIHYIIIATDFSTLLSHSVASHILGGTVNLLCLVPSIQNDNLILHIHFPKSWTDIGQGVLPDNAFVSYTLYLSKKRDADILPTFNIANDLLVYDARQYATSGFFLLWENCRKENVEFDYAYSIYLLNPFAFLPHAVRDELPFNKNSTFYSFITEYVQNNGPLMHSDSFKGITDRAVNFLKTYFEIEWGMLTSWEIDIGDEVYKYQRFPVMFDSWGAIGDYVRYYYLHPAVQRFYFSQQELVLVSCGYFSPIIGLQIINGITGKKLFREGRFFVSDIFRFGIQLHFYKYACRNALETGSDSSIAFLYWTNVHLLHSFKEIRFRVDSIKNIDNQIPQLEFYFSRQPINPHYESVVDSFAEWFKYEFLKGLEFNQLLFDFAYQYGMYFNDFYRKILSNNKNHVSQLEAQLVDISKSVLFSVVDSVKQGSQNMSVSLMEALNQIYCYGHFEKLTSTDLKNCIDSQSDLVHIDNFASVLLDVLDETLGEVSHSLTSVRLPDSVDFMWLKQVATQRFNSGLRHTVLNIAANGEISIGQLVDELHYIGSLNNPDEVFVQSHQVSGMLVINKLHWDEIANEYL